MSEPRDVASSADAGGKPWGPWSTLGLGLLLVVLWSVVQAIALVVLAGPRVKASDATAQGSIFAGMLIISMPIVVAATLLLARLRKGIGVATYLGLRWPAAREAFRWALILAGLIAATDALSVALGRSVVPESMIQTFRTAGSLPIFLIAIIVAAPVGEEFIFRGFVLPGLLASRLGPIGAIAVTALAWGSLHFQYDLYGMACVAASGIVLGLVRWRTGSLWLCALLHGLMNGVATVEAMFILSRQ